MSTEATAHAQDTEHGHHKETFVSKYVFSQDHKMKARRNFARAEIEMQRLVREQDGRTQREGHEK